MKYSEHHITTSLQPSYLLRLMPGEELLETLTQFCKDKNISGGTVVGIGGTTDAILCYFNQKTKKYEETPYAGRLYEVVNLTGNISIEKIHIHVTIADNNNQALAGHCGKLVADPALEVSITPFKETHRVENKASGLMLLDLDKEC